MLGLHQIFPLRDFGEFVVAQDVAQLPKVSRDCDRCAGRELKAEREEPEPLQAIKCVRNMLSAKRISGLPAETLTKSRLISATQSMSMPSTRATDALAAWKPYSQSMGTQRVKIRRSKLTRTGEMRQLEADSTSRCRTLCSQKSSFVVNELPASSAR